MKRGGFPRPTIGQVREKAALRATAPRKPLSRKKPLSPALGGSRLQGGKLAKKKGTLGAGKKTKEWRTVWQWLKPRLQAAGRTSCEFAFIPHECWGRLDPAHSKKRREMEGNDIYAVSIACAQVHTILDEQLTHSEMETAVLRAINNHGGMILPTLMR